MSCDFAHFDATVELSDTDRMFKTHSLDMGCMVSKKTLAWHHLPSSTRAGHEHTLALSWSCVLSLDYVLLIHLPLWPEYRLAHTKNRFWKYFRSARCKWLLCNRLIYKLNRNWKYMKILFVLEVTKCQKLLKRKFEKTWSDEFFLSTLLKSS